MNRLSRALAVAPSLWMAGPALAAPPQGLAPPGIQPGGDVSTNTVTATGGTAARTGAARAADAFNVLDFGAKGDGSTDDAAAFNAAEAACSGANKQLLIPNTGKNYILGSASTLLSNCQVRGLGNPVLQAKAGSNITVMEGLNYQSLVGTDSGSSGISNFSVSDLTIDGNSANNTAPGAKAGLGLAFVGRQFLIDHVTIQNTYRTGLWTEYASGASFGVSPYDGHVRSITINGTGEHGWYNLVSDLHFSDVDLRTTSLNANNSFCGLYLAPGKGSVRGNNLNIWSTGVSAAALPKYALCNYADGTTINGVHLEMGYTANLFDSGNNVNMFGLNSYNLGASATKNVVWDGGAGFLNGQIYPGASGGTNFAAIQLGDSAGVSSAVNQNSFDIHAYQTQLGLVDWTYSGGNNRVTAQHNLAAGAAMQISTPKTGDVFNAQASGPGGDTRFGGAGVSAIAQGQGATATAQNAVAIGTNASASSGCEAIGPNNACANFGQFVSGTRAQADANWGARVHAAGQVASAGDSEIYELHWRGVLTGTAAQTLFLDNSSQQAVIPVNTTWAFDGITLNCRLNGGAATLERVWRGSVSRGSAAAALDGTGATATDLITPASGWSATLTAGNSGVVSITVTGVSGATCGARMAAMKVSS